MKRCCVGLGVLFLCVPVLVAGEQTWPRFRGPTGDGAAANADPPIEWSDTKNIAWKVAVPGRGRSSPVILGNRIWLTIAIEQNPKRTRIGPDDMQIATHVSFGAVCLDRADGKLLWQVALFEHDNPAPVHWLNSWATPTPVVEPGRMYCDFGTFGTACLDAETGKTVWSKRLPLNHQVGPGSSVVLYENLLVLVRDGLDAQYVTALDKNTGQEVWKTPRPPLTGSNDTRKSFTTPLAIETGGRTQMVSVGAKWVVSYEPASGKELWRARHSDGWSIGSCPIFGGGMVFLSTGCTKPQMVAVRADGQGDVTGTHIAWKSLRNVPVMSSALLVGDEVYWVSDTGMACCNDAKSGEQVWQQALGGSHLASPTHAAGRLYLFGQDGKAVVLKAGRQFTQLAANQLQGTVVATPAFIEKSIYLRTDSHLYRIEEPKP